MIRKLKKKTKNNQTGLVNFIKFYFNIDDQSTTVRKEVIGGIVTFLSMAYILFVNPDMISNADGGGFSEVSFGTVFYATAISAAISTIAMGIIARLPIALAPGMGLNAFFVFNIGKFGLGFDYYEALATVFISGILFLGLSLSGARTHLINAIPKCIKFSMGAGIGLFIAFIGLIGSGIITPGLGTPLSIGDFTQPTVLLAAFGIVLAIVLYIKNITGGILIAMFTTAVVGAIANELIFAGDHAWVDRDNWVASLPKLDFSFKIEGGFSEMFAIPLKMFEAMGRLFSDNLAGALAAIIIFLFVDFFDTAGTIVAVGEQAGLTNQKGELENASEALMIDASGTILGSMIGTSTVTAFVESGTGVAAGAKTGLASVVTGIMFIFAIFIFPFIFPLITSQVTALALVMVGALMFGQLKLINWKDDVTVITSFFMITLMVLTYAIYWGIVSAFIIYGILMLVKRREKEVSIPMWILSILSIVFFIIEFVVIKNV